MGEIDRIRAFNRFYTGWLGILDRSYLGSGMTLTEVRVLHDLAALGPVTARELIDRLHLDEGYLSRVLARFVKRGWVSRRHDHRDRRRRHLSLTPAGRAEAEALVARSHAAIERSLADLGPVARADLVEAMGRVQATLSRPEGGEVTFRDLEIGDAGWIASRHALLYAAEEGYDATFEALVARLLADFVERRDPSTERAFIPVAAGVRLGAVFCMRDDPETARLRMFFLEPFARGLGLGRRMLEEVIGFASLTGARRLVLWTHESHRAACRLYAARGFVMQQQQPARAFGQDTIEQVWELAL
jgi:DNA-binding MarR family transcriptional regulator